MQKSPEYLQAFGDECAHDTENMVNHILYFDQEKNNNTHSLPIVYLMVYKYPF